MYERFSLFMSEIQDIVTMKKTTEEDNTKIIELTSHVLLMELKGSSSKNEKLLGIIKALSIVDTHDPTISFNCM